MKYSDWIRKLQPHLTSKGARLDMRVYVYPDGHGNIILQQGEDTGQPVNSLDEAMQIFKDLWEKASVANQSHNDGGSQPDLAEMIAGITPENLHEEIVDHGPVGNEVW